MILSDFEVYSSLYIPGGKQCGRRLFPGTVGKFLLFLVRGSLAFGQVNKPIKMEEYLLGGLSVWSSGDVYVNILRNNRICIQKFHLESL